MDVWKSFPTEGFSAVHSVQCVNPFLGSRESSTVRPEDNEFKNESNVGVVL